MKIGKAFLGAVILIYFLCPFAYATDYGELPGQEFWEPYLEQAPQDAQDFVSDPIGFIKELLPADPARMFAEVVEGYSDVILLLLLAMTASFLSGDTQDSAFGEMLSAGGCGVLLWNDLSELAAALCDKMQDWRSFLLGFLPVYSGVLTACGEANAGIAANGLLLSGLCLLAQAVAYGARPVIQSYLAISMACCISTQAGLAETCRLAGKGMRQGIAWAGTAFSLLLGLQRIVSCQLDQSTVRISRLLAGSVPVVGQALGNASEAILSGMRILKSSLGLAALAIIGAEFLPFYITLWMHRLLLYGCGLIAEISGNYRSKALLDCFGELVRCMSAVTALFFEIFLVGVILMAVMGGG